VVESFKAARNYTNSKQPDWWKPPPPTVAPPPPLPQVHRIAAPAAWSPPIPAAAPTSNPAQGWQSTPGAIPGNAPIPGWQPSAAAPTSNPAQGWQSVPGAAATPQPVQSTPQWNRPTAWNQSPTVLAPSPTPAPTTNTEGAAATRIVQLLERQTTLMEHMSQRLDEIAADEDDRDGSQGLEHEHTRSTTGPQHYAEGAAGSKQETPAGPSSRPPALDASSPPGTWDALRRFGGNILGVR
jgi:hypothetical protein